MKAKTTTKPLKDPINLSKSPVRFTPTGSIEPVALRGHAHPGVEGRGKTSELLLLNAADRASSRPLTKIQDEETITINRSAGRDES